MADRTHWYWRLTDEQRAERNKNVYRQYRDKVDAMSEQEKKVHYKKRAEEKRLLWIQDRLAKLWTLCMEANWRCSVCGEVMDMADVHIDHIEPQSKGGEDYYGNLQALHGYCNQIKGDRSQAWAVEEFRSNPDHRELRYMTPAGAMSDRAQTLAPPFYKKGEAK